MVIKIRLSVHFRIINGHWLGIIAEKMAIKVLYSDKVMINKLMVIKIHKNGPIYGHFFMAIKKWSK